MTVFDALKPSSKNLRYWRGGPVRRDVCLPGTWCRADDQYAFFIGEPIKVAGRVWSWFMP